MSRDFWHTNHTYKFSECVYICYINNFYLLKLLANQFFLISFLTSCKTILLDKVNILKVLESNPRLRFLRMKN